MVAGGPRKKLQIHFDWLLLRKARWPWKGTIQLHDFRTLKNLHRIDIDSGRFSLPLDIYWQSGRFHRTWSRWSRQESWIGGAGHRPVHNYEINWSILLNWFHKTIYGIVRYHGMHPVVALGVRHEGLPQLVHLLVFQLLNQEVVLKGSRNWRGKSPGAFYGSETLCARLLHNSGKLSQPRVDTSQMLDTSKMAELWSTNLFAHFRVHVRRAWQFKPGMGICAFGSCRAKSCQVVDAEHPAHMSVPAVGTVPTEACSIWSFSSLLWS